MHPEFINENDNKENLDSRMLDTTIEELDLTIRAYHVLKRNNFLTVRDIIKFGPYNIIELRNAGKKTAKEVLDTILPYIQAYNISRPNKNNQNSSVYNGPQNLDSVISYTWEIKGGGPSGTNAKEVSAFI